MKVVKNPFLEVEKFPVRFYDVIEQGTGQLVGTSKLELHSDCLVNTIVEPCLLNEKEPNIGIGYL